MRRGLGAHKRKTRRISTGGAARGRSASPRPSLGGQGRQPHAAPAAGGPPIESRKANSAPSSPLESSAAEANAWRGRRGLPAKPGGAVSARAGDTAAAVVVADSVADEVPPPPPSTTAPKPRLGNSQQQGGKEASAAEPTMGTMFTEWFQKLFAPNEGNNNSNSHSSGNSNTAGSTKPARGANNASNAGSNNSNNGSSTSAGGRSTAAGASARASGEENDFPSNKTSAASDFTPRPPTPPHGAPSSSGMTDSTHAAGAAMSSTSGNAADQDAYDGAAPTEESPAPTEESAGGRASATAGASSADAGGAGGEQSGKDGNKDDPALSPRFLGLFTRGFGGGGSNKESNSSSKEKDVTPATAASTTSSSADPSAPPSSTPVGSTQQDVVAGKNGDLAAAAGAATAGAAAAAASAAAAEQGAPAASGGARRMAREGSSGTASRSTSPSRAQALSVGSDDGEEENLYTAGTHQGARPSIDDFSSLRVLGKGSYGKVVLVRRKNTGVLYAMKILKKGDVVRKRQVERTKIERRVLGNVEHPFLMRLHYAFQTDNKLYLVLDYCPGGELFFHLSRYKRFPEGVVRFYAAELVLALRHLHDNNIIYRDIKPENILLDADGHIKLGDFGLAKDNVSEATFGAQSVCGTPEYMAPEVINKAGHGTAVDWWGLGMLMYEMLTGLPPWYTKDRQKLFERLRGAPLVIPKNVSAPSASIIGGLLTRNPSKRLGTHGALQVMNHEFFRGLDWASLLAKRIPAPLNPCRNQRQGSESTHNFDPQFTRMPIDTMSLGGGIVSPGPDGHFDGFTYEVPGVILEGDGGDR